MSAKLINFAICSSDKRLSWLAAQGQHKQLQACSPLSAAITKINLRFLWSEMMLTSWVISSNLNEEFCLSEFWLCLRCLTYSTLHVDNRTGPNLIRILKIKFKSSPYDRTNKTSIAHRHIMKARAVQEGESLKHATSASRNFAHRRVWESITSTKHNREKEWETRDCSHNSSSSSTFIIIKVLIRRNAVLRLAPSSVLE